MGRAPWRTHPESWILSLRAHALTPFLCYVGSETKTRIKWKSPRAHALSPFCARLVQKQKQEKHKNKDKSPCTYSTFLCPCANMLSLFVSEFCRKTKTKTNSLKVKVPARSFRTVSVHNFSQFLRYFYLHYGGVLSAFCATFVPNWGVCHLSINLKSCPTFFCCLCMVMSCGYFLPQLPYTQIIHAG